MDTFPRSFEPDQLLSDVGWVRALSQHLVRDPTSAEDVAQDTWLAALRSWPGESPTRKWLAHVARNVERSRRRGETRRADHEVGAAREAARRDVDQLAPDELVARMEVQRRLADAVLALPEPYRSTILWRYVEGLQPAEIAQRCKLPDATVRGRARRGLEMLRMELDRASGGDRREWFGVLMTLARTPPLSTSTAALGAWGGLAVMKGLLATVSLVALILLTLYAARRTPPANPGVSDTARGSSLPGAGDSSRSAPLDRDTNSASQRTNAAVTASSQAGRLAVRLRDDASGAVVPYLRVALVDADGTREELESDAVGIVRSRRGNGAFEGALDLSSADHGSDLVQVNTELAHHLVRSIPVHAPATGEDVDTDGLEVGVRIPTGPRWFLAGAFPEGRRANEFLARLTSADPRKAFDALYAVPREVEGTWIRFSDKSRAMAGGPPWKIFIGSNDGLWSCSFVTDSIVGTHTAPLQLAFESTARIRGRVLDPGGRPHGPEVVQLWRPGASFQDASNRPVVLRTDDEGRFDARWLPAGSYELRMEVARHMPVTQSLSARAGETQTVEVLLVPRVMDGVLDVVLSSDTGTYSGVVRVMVVPEVGSREMTSKTPEWVGPTAHLRLTDLARVKHEVRLEARDGTPITPRVVHVDPSGPEVAFVVHDRTPMTDLTFDVRDRDTRASVPFETFRVVVVDLATEEFLARSVDKKTMRTRIPRAGRYRVEVHAAGYRPLVTEIAPVGTDPIALSMRPGWGTEVTVVDSEDHPLAGARIECDGAEVGIANALGIANVEHDAPPQAMFARLEGWRVAKSSDTDPVTGSFRAWLPWVKIRMERSKP